ncbi:hypothetical protein ELE36_04900 [Pseudolysobacter antarcticus]|uniref:Uncharacterized protein n=1 Tax=Pseudolysobacter antarcticus TaxID=2511995 RepID=A0A411HGZ3_9GAMM|nr:choice-of-anchor Q domain-containing protein [Pseudolysobacter antarcticus]QBB69765.1 hypothetical protein ELE36_04900 [Pseudolysobacter antarcticus]
MDTRSFFQHSLPSLLVRTLFAVPLMGFVASSAVHAASDCANSNAQLKADLAKSETQADNAPYTIKLMQGTYNLGYTIVNPTSQLTIAGGYTDASCTTRSIDPANTRIDFGGTGFLHIAQNSASPIASITLEGITFQNGESVSLFTGGYNQFSADDAGNISIRNSRFTGLNSTNPPDAYFFEDQPIQFTTYKGTLSIVNSVFDHLIQAPGGVCEAVLDLWDDAAVVMMFDSIHTSSGQSFCIEPDSTGSKNTVQVFNSIFWPTDGLYGTNKPLYITDSGGAVPDVSLYYSTFYLGFDGPATTKEFNTLTGPQNDPQWLNPVAGPNANYGISPTSSAINSGYPAPINNFYPSIDIASSPRTTGGAVDRGAVESPYFYQSSTIVTNTNNAGQGSLRDAITVANKSGNADTITFSPQLGCPAVIQLTSALPNITTPITIDGYLNNPAAVYNSDPNAFNANLCIVIKEQTYDTIATGLSVMSPGSLDLRGVAMGGFTQQVFVASNATAKISGSQFGGSVGGINLPGANANAIAVFNVTNGKISIGGDSPGERNVINNATSNGIFMDSTVSTPNCSITNNLVGLAPNGVSANGNGYGMQLKSSYCDVSKNRVAGNFNDGIWIPAQGSHNKIHGNVFGMDVLGNPVLSYGWAVLVDGSNNVIGDSQLAGYHPDQGNVISYMGDGGVLVNNYSNSVRANLSSYNGYAHDGSVPDIKLGPNGNFQQGFPVIDSLSLPNGMPVGSAKPGTITAHLNSGANSSYRVDVYYSGACSPSGRGHAEFYLGSQLVNTNASGYATFSMPLMLPDYLPTSVISLTATDAYANSSEMGSCFAIKNFDDTIFRDKFGG